MYALFDIRDKQELLDDVVHYYWKQWGSDSNYQFYKDCIGQSCKTDSDVPRFYIIMDNTKIIGSYALLRSELNSRQDLTPWLACLFVDPAYRGEKLGALLQKDALKQTRARGYRRLYLCTELTGYYERTGWTHIGDGYLLNDERTRIYEQEV